MESRETIAYEFYDSGTIILKENGTLIKEEKKLVEIFNDHYINIVQTTTGITPTNLRNPVDPIEGSRVVELIIESFKVNPIIVKIKQNVIAQANLASFSFPQATKEEINCILKNINPKKSTDPDIPPK